MRVSSGVCSIAKAWPWANQDASFSTNRCFGVFDGVSAAPQSREYAQLLASSTRAQLMQAQRDGFGEEPWPGQAQAVLRRAAAAAKGLNGAATSCMIRLDGDKGRLAVYNLGDSGFLLFSPSADGFRVCARSSPRTHSDGTPYQLAGGASLLTDSPNSGVGATHTMAPGMVALLHTDGLLDNLDVDEIVEIVSRRRNAGAAALARALAEQARAAKRVADDITVLAITIEEAAPSSVRSSMRRGTLLGVVLAASSIGARMPLLAAPADASATSELPLVPILELIKIYGRLAGSDCFGASVPSASGASCQLGGKVLQTAIGSGGGEWSEAQFIQWLGEQPFRWPLKPWGTARSQSNAKTVMMNKSAETAVFMGELERRGMYDPRNPTGPLPTSLRPRLNAAVGAEPIDPAASRLVFRALAGAEAGEATPVLSSDRLARALSAPGEEAEILDYYSFQALIGRYARLVWPS